MQPIEEGALYGAFVIRHREVLREKLGKDVVRAALNELVPEHAGAVEGATALQWVPVEAIEAFFAAVSRQTGRDAAAIHEEFGAVTTERTILTVWRVLLRLTTDSQLVSQVPVLYRKTWNRGTLTARMEGPGRATLSLTGWPGVPEFPARGVRIAVLHALRLSGRKQVQVDRTRQTDGMSYSVSWAR